MALQSTVAAKVEDEPVNDINEALGVVPVVLIDGTPPLPLSSETVEWVSFVTRLPPIFFISYGMTASSLCSILPKTPGSSQQWVI